MYSSPFTCSERIVNNSGVRCRHVTVDPSPEHHSVPFLRHMANNLLHMLNQGRHPFPPRGPSNEEPQGLASEQEDRGRRGYQTQSHPSLLRLPYKTRSLSIIFRFLTRGNKVKYQSENIYSRKFWLSEAENADPEGHPPFGDIAGVLSLPHPRTPTAPGAAPLSPPPPTPAHGPCDRVTGGGCRRGSPPSGRGEPNSGVTACIVASCQMRPLSLVKIIPADFSG